MIRDEIYRRQTDRLRRNVRLVVELMPRVGKSIRNENTIRDRAKKLRALLTREIQQHEQELLRAEVPMRESRVALYERLLAMLA